MDVFTLLIFVMVLSLIIFKCEQVIIINQTPHLSLQYSFA